MNGRLYYGMTGWQVVCAKCEHKVFLNGEFLTHNGAEVWLRANGWLKKNILWICPECKKRSNKSNDDAEYLQ